MDSVLTALWYVLAYFQVSHIRNEQIQIMTNVERKSRVKHIFVVNVGSIYSYTDVY